MFGVKVDVLEGTIIDPFMHFVNKFELISLEIIACQYLNDVILVDKPNYLFNHAQVAFDIIRHSKRAQVVHSSKFINQCIIRSLERMKVESQRWAVLPIINFKKNLNDVANVVLLIEGLTLCIGESI